MLLVYIYIYIFLFIFLKNKENKENFNSPFDDIQLVKALDSKENKFKETLEDIYKKINCCYKNQNYHSKMKMEFNSVFNRILD